MAFGNLFQGIETAVAMESLRLNDPKTWAFIIALCAVGVAMGEVA